MITINGYEALSITIIHPDYPQYLATAEGRVFLAQTLGKQTNYIEIPYIVDPFGYRCVEILLGRAGWALFYVHHLVLRTFRPVRDGQVGMKHVNGNPGDNRLDNLTHTYA